MGQALDLAREAHERGEVPVGAIVFSHDGEVIGRGFNTREGDADPTGHAEVNAIREAALVVGEWRLEDCTIVVT
ncbi:MAG: nucleoside deaminase, partial [Aeromicrobium sp.]